MGKIITNGFKLTLGEDLKLLRFEKHQLVNKDAGDTIYNFQRVGT